MRSAKSVPLPSRSKSLWLSASFGRIKKARKTNILKKRKLIPITKPKFLGHNKHTFEKRRDKNTPWQRGRQRNKVEATGVEGWRNRNKRGMILTQRLPRMRRMWFQGQTQSETFRQVKEYTVLECLLATAKQLQ
jgi:hypothetical protein